MTGPAEQPRAGEKHSGGLAQLVRWLNEDRPMIRDDVGFVAGAPRRVARWTYGDPPVSRREPEPDDDREVLGEVRIGPAPRCAVAGEMIALSVSLINTRGGMYLGWPIKLEWSSSDPSIASVSEIGVVQVHAKGRVELTCRCEGKSGSVLLTVVEPAVAAAVGLPVPPGLLAAARRRGQASAPFPEPVAASGEAVASPTPEPTPEPTAPPIVRAAVPRSAAAAVSPSAPLPGQDGTQTLAYDATNEKTFDHAKDGAPRQPLLADSATPAAPATVRTAIAPITPTLAAPAARPAPTAPERVAEPRATPAAPIDRAVRARSAATRALPAEFPVDLPFDLAPQPPPVYRRSVERGAVRHPVLASLVPSRATRRVLFRVAVGAATGGFVAMALTQNPEDYFVAGVEQPTAMAAQVSAGSRAQARRPQATSAALRRRASAPASATTASTTSAPLGDTSNNTALAQSAGRVVAEAAGSTTVTAAVPAATATPAPSAIQNPPATTPPPTPAPAPTVSRVVLANSPSQLTEGETVRLSAAGVDDRGEPLTGRAVTWTSENGDIAVVDGNGVVTARRPGTVTITANSEGRTGRVTLTVGPRRTPPVAEQPAAAARPARETGAVAAAQAMRARADEFVQALRERNSERVAALYRAEAAQDRKNLQALLDRLRRPEARLKASDAQLGATEVREMEATVDFQVPMSWTTPFGRVRSHTATFRAVLEPGDGGWRLVAIRAVGKIE